MHYCLETNASLDRPGHYIATPGGLSDVPKKDISSRGAIKDDDGDGLANQEEEKFNTDPQDPDTDGDGYPDKKEIQEGYNPTGEGKLNPDKN